MKRLLSVVFIVVLCLAFGSQFAFALEIPNVADMAGVLTAAEAGELNESLFALEKQYEMAVCAVIDEEFYSYDAQSSADDRYDDYGYGYGSNSDGILFYISVDEREYHFSTHGAGISIFNDDAISYLKREAEPYLRADDYYGAVSAYREAAGEILLLAESGTVYEETDWTYVAVIIGGAIAVTFLIAFVMMGIQLAKMNTAVSDNYAKNYVKEGSYHLDMARDIFLYSHITKVKKETSNSSTHRSSSGRTHGGGGGSF